MEVNENDTFRQEYYDAEKRYIGNAVQVFFNDGSMSRRVAVDFPIGHRKRRAEGMPMLMKKFESSVSAQFDPLRSRHIIERCADHPQLEAVSVHDLVEMLG